MAALDTSNLAATDPAVRLSQFLFVGKEYADYQPGNWFFHDYFLVSKLLSIEALAEDTEKQLLPLELIQRALDSDLVPNPETLVFALAICCKQTKSSELSKQAYSKVAEICTSPEQLILFVKFITTICKHKELNPDNKPSNGWGYGLKRSVNNWYFSKDPFELAKCIMRCNGRYGWKHKDIIKLSHPTSDQSERGAVLKYIVRGLAETKEAFSNNESVKKILEYIEEIENFKRCEDEVRAAGLVETHALTLDHIPGHLLKSAEVWHALIPLMDIKLLLKNLQRIHNLGFLKDSPIVATIVDQIINQENLKRDKVHPALILITIRDYENSGRALSYEKRKIRESAKKPLPPPPKPNSKIIDALYKTLNLSFAHLQPTGLRYMVTINMNKPMLEARAWRSANVNCAEAGCMIALALVRCEKSVTVATFKNVGIHTVNLDKTASFGQAMRRLQQMPVGTVNLSKPMSWAAHQNNKYDVFINVVDQVFEKSDSSEEALANYRTKLKLPNTKLINCAVCSPTTYQKNTRDKNVLTINGFDASVPKVIQAFAKSLF